MSLSIDEELLLAVPLYKFFIIPNTKQGITSCIYLISKPLTSVKIDIMPSPIKIGVLGSMQFLTIANSYRLGYFFEFSEERTTIYSDHITIGPSDVTLASIKDTEVLFSDNNINLIRCKALNAYCILQSCNLDFPVVNTLVTKLKLELEA